MTGLTGSTYTQALAIKQLMLDHAVAWGVRPSSVYYGDQEKLPFTPSICVESGPKRRELEGVPRRVATFLTTYVMIYHGLITDSETIRLSNDAFIEQVEMALDESDTLNGILIHGFCTDVEPGWARRSGTLYRATRITYQGRSKEQLPLP